MLQMLTTEMNRYAELKIRTHSDPIWQPVNMEMAAFIGLRFNISVVALPIHDQYWSTDPVFWPLPSQDHEEDLL